MSNGWENSAQAWIDSMGERGERGDWGRKHVLDPVMMARVASGRFGNALDVGCGEGRFCRMLKAAGIKTTGIDPTRPLLDIARQQDPGGDYRVARAEQLDFPDASFDLAVSYITLIDIPDFRAAIGEMARVLRPGGSLLVANLTGFTSACADREWDGPAVLPPRTAQRMSGGLGSTRSTSPCPTRQPLQSPPPSASIRARIPCI